MTPTEWQIGNDADNLGLRDRRRRLGGLRSRKSPLGGRPPFGAAARGRPSGSIAMDPHSDRIREDDVPSGLQLALQDRAGAGNERKKNLLAPRPYARRFERDQRPYLHPRPARRL